MANCERNCYNESLIIEPTCLMLATETTQFYYGFEYHTNLSTLCACRNSYVGKR